MRKNKGFTLIELVIVITIIGILAAFALPRFMNLQRDARIAKLNAARGAVTAAAALVHSTFLARGGAADTINCPAGGGIADNVTRICTESGVTAIFNGYPDSTDIPSPTAPGIVGVAGLTTIFNPTPAQLQAEGYSVERSGNDTIVRISTAQDPTQCQFVYTRAQSGAAPVISQPNVDRC